MTGAGVAAFGAGVATFFAPCAYPLLPGYVGYVAREGDVELSGVVARGFAASAGVLAVFGGIVVVLAAAGRTALGALAYAEPVVGAGLVAFGVAAVLDRVPSLHVALPERRQSVVGFALFGAAYAAAAVGCFLPVFVATLSGALSVSTAASVGVVAAYATGMAVPMLGATLAVGVGLDVGRPLFVRHAALVRRAAGLVVLLAGLGQLARSVEVIPGV
ncbi:cytochrome c biogenesis CcdA family protein [Halomicrococcus gelatinilyticus]|uniref:cytochrome c biogenesis CcdA family protein n=1 Tax=Halomicrococcus gelatinilyticus TaxID=1702103 RepID=UPI002E0F7A0B